MSQHRSVAAVALLEGEERKAAARMQFTVQSWCLCCRVTVWQPFCDITGTHPKGMMSMLKMLKLSHIGRHHSGIGMQFADSSLYVNNSSSSSCYCMFVFMWQSWLRPCTHTW